MSENRSNRTFEADLQLYEAIGNETGWIDSRARDGQDTTILNPQLRVDFRMLIGPDHLVKRTFCYTPSINESNGAMEYWPTIVRTDNGGDEQSYAMTGPEVWYYAPDSEIPDSDPARAQEFLEELEHFRTMMRLHPELFRVNGAPLPPYLAAAA